MRQQPPRQFPAIEIERVLIYRLGSLGDTVVALPSFHQIARAFPNAERRLLTNLPVHAKAPAAAAVLGDSGLVHAYIDYPVGMRNPLQILAVAAEIRRFRPQLLIYLAAIRGQKAVRRDRLFFRFCGIQEIIGLPESLEDFGRRKIPGTDDFEPEAQRLALSIAALGTADLGTPESWEMRFNAAELDRANEVLRQIAGAPFLTASVGTKAQSKDWGEANWTELLVRMAALFPAHRLVLMGAPDEAEVSARASAAWGERGLNLCGNLNPRASAALLRSADLFVGHDSGPMHLAAAAGAPCVAIFAARHLPRIWFPYGARHRVLYHQTDCAGCGLETCIEQRKKCILSITVDEVLDAVMGQFQDQFPASPTSRTETEALRILPENDRV